MAEAKKRRTDYTRNWKSAHRNISKMNASDLQTHDYGSSDDEVNIIPGNISMIQGEQSAHSSTSRANSCDVNMPMVRDHVTDDDASNYSDNDSDHDADIWDPIDRQINLILQSSESENESDDGVPLRLREGLATWSNLFQIKHNAIDALLKLLRQYGHNYLPRTARTLLKTTREVQTETKSGMEYVHLGLKNQLDKYLQNYPVGTIENVNTLNLSLNIDGLPLFNSTTKSSWPILCAILVDPVQIFPVTLTCGKQKPTDLEFMQDTIDELRELMQQGIEFKDHLLQVELKSIICDAPAKAMVKRVKQYSGYHGCDKCDQRGTWMKKITYTDIDDLNLRTDATFRGQTNAEHHHGVSPFCDLDIDMVTVFPIDYMHQSCLGVMKRLLLMWMRGKREQRLSANQIAEISNKLLSLKQFIPSSFARKPRNLEEVDRWKATELRQFLLYTGKIVLADILQPELFNHFMTLNVAMCILICPRLASQYRDYAQELLVYFVKTGHLLYGQGFLVYNVHCLLHIAKEAEEYGSLDQCSAFPFENYLHKLKRLVRSGKHPIVQIVKRLEESEPFGTLQKTVRQYNSVQSPNNAYICDNGKCCEVVAITNEDDENGVKKLLCRIYERTESLFMEPCNSTLVGTYAAHPRHTRMQVMRQEQVHRNALMVRQAGKLIFMAILHEF